MVFSSAIFLFVFFPLVFGTYHLIPGMKAKNLLLAIASVIFYAFGNPAYTLLLLASVICNYAFGCILSGGFSRRRAALAAAVVLNVGFLCVFKYLDFFIENINAVTGLGLPLVGIALPVGISFYTFQGMSYVIDVYRDRQMGSRSFSKLLLYISFFPQLVAGPIIKFHDISPQLDSRVCTMEDTALGLRRFIVGLGKKLLIANTMGYTADAVFALGESDMNAALAWTGAICYTLQIYFDFSGYSDMALGLGRIFGLRFAENFRYPYAACGIRDFWKGWHISLTSWFREYLYIPLGGNRKGRLRTSLNKLIVFFTTGIWHGASWTFVIWGMWHGLLSVLEDMKIIPVDKWKGSLLGRATGHVYTMLAVILGFVVFRADTLSQAWLVISNMFTGFTMTAQQQILTHQLCYPLFLFGMAGAFVLSLPVLPFFREKAEKSGQTGRKLFEGASFVLGACLFVLCLLNLSSATYNPFIYFRF